MVSMQPSHGLKRKSASKPRTQGTKRKGSRLGLSKSREAEGESKVRKLEAKKKKDFVYPWHWHRPEMGRCAGEERVLIHIQAAEAKRSSF